MITDKTLDEALVELLRTKRALRAERKILLEKGQASCGLPGSGYWSYFPSATHAAGKCATLDLTRKLAQLRAGK